MNSDILKHVRKQARRRRFSTGEFAIALLAALAPLFILANEIDGDEWTKGGIGAIVSGVVLAVTAVIRAHFGSGDEESS